MSKCDRAGYLMFDLAFVSRDFELWRKLLPTRNSNSEYFQFAHPFSCFSASA